MKRTRKSIKPPQILLAAIMAMMTIMLPFQAHAYKPLIINQTLPEAVTGSFYCAQLLADGLEKNAVWKAEGLPDGVGIDPGNGIIFGTAKKPGVFEVIVTVQSGWWWRPRINSKSFRLNVLPPPTGEPSAKPTPDNSGGITMPPPGTGTPAPDFAIELQPSAESAEIAAVPAIHTFNVKWLKLEANGKKGVETTTGLRLEFSRDIKLEEWDYFFCIGIKGNAAEITSFSKYIDDNGCTVYLGINNIDPNLKNGNDIEVNFEAYPEALDYLNLIGVSLDKTSMSVKLNFEVSDSEKILLAHDELTPESLLGGNTNPGEITSDLVLPLSNPDYKCDISWQSSSSTYISESGLVTRPNHSEGDKQVMLTATIACGNEYIEKSFLFTVKPLAEDSTESLPEDPPADPAESLPENPPTNPAESLPENPPADPAESLPENPPTNPAESLPENPPADPTESLPEVPDQNPSESLPEFIPNIAPTTPNMRSSKSESTAKAASAPTQTRTSSNVDKSGTVNRTAIINELKNALKDAKGSFAVIKAKNAQSISPRTLRALAAAAEAGGIQAVLHADTVTQGGKVDARLYLKPASLAGTAEPLKLGIATKGNRPEKIKNFFIKYYDNEVSVISCEQQGGFGAKLQIAVKVELPEDIGNLVFYSYDAHSNTFSRIFTAYRLDANGYLRFATEKAGDIVVSNGILKKRYA